MFNKLTFGFWSSPMAEQVQEEDKHDSFVTADQDAVKVAKGK